MGGEGDGLAMAIRYPSVLCVGASVIWVFNALLALVREQGSIRLATTVVRGCAVLMVPLSPVGAAGVGALAGYGAGARLEILLVPLSAGTGFPAGVIVGTNAAQGPGA